MPIRSFKVRENEPDEAFVMITGGLVGALGVSPFHPLVEF